MAEEKQLHCVAVQVRDEDRRVTLSVFQVSTGKNVHLGCFRAHCVICLMTDDTNFIIIIILYLLWMGVATFDTARGRVSERWKLHWRQSNASCQTAVCLGQLSLLPSAGRKMTILYSVGYGVKAPCGWLWRCEVHRWFNCPLAKVIDGRIMRCSAIPLVHANQLPLPRL